MRKYKTWEVMKMLREDNRLKFEYITCNERIVLSSAPDKELIYECFNKEGKKLSKLDSRRRINRRVSLNTTWKLITGPVGFDEVLRNDKRCKVEHELINSFNFCNDRLEKLKEYALIDEVLFRISGDLDTKKFIKVIKEGKWYLEE